jgi:hypothetical protein
MRYVALCGAVGAFALTSLSTATVVQFKFNSNPADANVSTGSNAPFSGVGTLGIFGAVSPSYAAGSANDTTSPTDNSAISLTNFAPTGVAANNGTRGLLMSFPMGGNPAPVTLSFDQRNSATAAKDWAVIYTVNGSTPTFGVAGTFTALTYQITTASVYQTVTAALGANASNASTVRVAIVAVQAGFSQYNATSSTSTYATTGTARIDNIIVVPTPGAFALMGLGALVAGRRKR